MHFIRYNKAAPRDRNAARNPVSTSSGCRDCLRSGPTGRSAAAQIAFNSLRSTRVVGKIDRGVPPADAKFDESLEPEQCLVILIRDRRESIAAAPRDTTRSATNTHTFPANVRGLIASVAAIPSHPIARTAAARNRTDALTSAATRRILFMTSQSRARRI